jgi:hypothetical protein
VVAHLLRLREPAAVMLLVVLGLRVVLAVVELSQQGKDYAAAVSGTGRGFGATELLTLVLLVLVVAGCRLWSPTPHSGPLTRAALVVCALGLLMALVEVVLVVQQSLRLPAGREGAAVGDLVRLVLALPVPVLGLLALARLLPEPTGAAAAPQPGVTAGTGDGAPAAIEAARPDPQNEPTWQPDQAAGAAWLTAGDAAAGASATRWGTPGDAGGWQPEPAAGRSGSGSPDPGSREPGSPEPGSSDSGPAARTRPED